MLKICLKSTNRLSNSIHSLLINLTVDNVSRLLQSNGMKVPPPGTIVRIGYKGSCLIYVYKFDHITRCSAASEDDFNLVKISERLLTPPIGIKRNVAWSFYCLNSDIQIDLSQFFKSSNEAQLHVDYVLFSLY